MFLPPPVGSPMRLIRISYAALLAASLLYGVTFVVVKDAMADFPPLAYVGWRFLLAGGLLVAIARPRSRQVWRDGTVAGVILFTGYALQTGGLVHTGASNSALITSLYVVFTPLLVAAARKRRPGIWTSGGTILAFVGIALLTSGGRRLNLDLGALMTLGCALAFAGHIAFLSYTASLHRVVEFTAVQLLITAIGGILASALFEDLPTPGTALIPSLIITGLGVSCLAFLLQVWAQRSIGANRTAIVLTLEPVFGVVSAAIILGERFTLSGWIGAATIFVAIGVVLIKDVDLPTQQAEVLAPVG